MARKKNNVILARRADVMLLRHTHFLAQVSAAAARIMFNISHIEYGSTRKNVVENQAKSDLNFS